MVHKVIAPAGSSQITIQTGAWARQAAGSITIQQGETIVLVAAVAAAIVRRFVAAAAVEDEQ